MRCSKYNPVDGLVGRRVTAHVHPALEIATPRHDNGPSVLRGRIFARWLSALAKAAPIMLGLAASQSPSATQHAFDEFFLWGSTFEELPLY